MLKLFETAPYDKVPTQKISILVTHSCYVINVLVICIKPSIHLRQRETFRARGGTSDGLLDARNRNYHDLVGTKAQNIYISTSYFLNYSMFVEQS